MTTMFLKAGQKLGKGIPSSISYLRKHEFPIERRMIASDLGMSVYLYYCKEWFSLHSDWKHLPIFRGFFSFLSWEDLNFRRLLCLRLIYIPDIDKGYYTLVRPMWKMFRDLCKIPSEVKYICCQQENRLSRNLHLGRKKKGDKGVPKA